MEALNTYDQFPYLQLIMMTHTDQKSRKILVYPNNTQVMLSYHVKEIFIKTRINNDMLPLHGDPTQIIFFVIAVFLKYLFVWLLQVLVVSYGIRGLCCSMQDLFSCHMKALICSVWDLVPQPGVKPRTSVLGVQSLNHWITKEAPMITIF